jgi:hypothetical protein
MRIVTNAHDGRTPMTKLARNAVRFALAAAAGTVCLFINDNMSTAQRSSLMSQADARVGHPGTPMSVAGVGRRHARRAVRRSYAARYGAGGYYGAYGGYPSAYYGAYAASPYGYFGIFPAYPGRYYGAYGGYPAGYYGGYPSYYER